MRRSKEPFEEIIVCSSLACRLRLSTLQEGSVMLPTRAYKSSVVMIVTVGGGSFERSQDDVVTYKITQLNGWYTSYFELQS